MQINRDPLEKSLYDFIISDNGIIIGSPGIGKTYLLKRICSRFKEQKIPYLYLPIDKFDVENASDLEEIFHYKGDFIEGLAGREEVQHNKGFFIIDSYDSAKSEKSKKFYLNLIRRAIIELKDTWQIIVSVRTFDAKKSQTLLELFRKAPEEKISQNQNLEILCRHFLIPQLTDIELSDALSKTLSPSEITLDPSTEIWDLLKTPFNFWLLEQIVPFNQSIKEIQKICSQVELLDFYWKARVHNTPLWEEKEILLKNATQKMVESKKLFVKIESIYQSDKKEAWNKLLSDQILVETLESNQKFSFSHNILFDYAVSILLLDESEGSFFSFISEDISRQLFLRPSLDFYFTRLWNSNFEQFWKIFWIILHSPEINLNILLRLTTINVLINEIKNVNDFNPIFSELKKGNPQGVKATLYVLQSLEIQDLKNDKTWLEFLEKVSVYQNRDFVWNFAWLLSKIIDNAKKEENVETLQYSGKIGRSLLTWVLEERKKERPDFIDGVGSSWVVPIVAKTFATDPKYSVVLLNEVLAIREESNFPIMYIYRLVDELENIWPSDPDFTQLVYLTILSYQETSQEKTSMGTPVLPLSSTRRQDYEMCYYILVKKYPKFLLYNPLSAAKAAIISLNQYIIQNHIIPFIKPGYHLEDLKKNYLLNNCEVLIYRDGCYIWDTSGYTEEPIKIADELFRFIEEKTEQHDAEIIKCLIKVFVETVEVPFFWRRLLVIAAKYPDIYANELFAFCLAKPILCGGETIKEMGDFLQNASNFFLPEQLIQIEKLILEIPKKNENNPDKIEFFKEIRDRLISRIPKDLLQTIEGIEIWNSMEQNEKFPVNEPLVKWGPSEIREYSEEECLRNGGADLSQESNNTLFHFFNTLEEFSTKWLNQTPDPTAIGTILPTLKEIYSLLGKETSANIKVKNSAWTHLASCVSEISGGINTSDIETFNFCKEVLLKCAHHAEPVFDPKYHSTFDSLAWSPDPRIEAAIGLSKLASVIRDQEILYEIRNLAIEDPVPAVRYLAISRLVFLRKTAPDFVWDLTTEIIQKEQIPNILFSACSNIGHFFRVDEKKAEKLLELFFETTVLMKNPDRSNPLIPIFVQLSVIDKNEWADGLLTKIITDPKLYSKHFGYIVFELSRLFDPKFSKDSQKYDEVSNRAFEMLNKLITATQIRIIELIPTIDKSKTIQIDSEINDLYLIIHEVVLRLFFAIEKNEGKSNTSKSRISDKKREKLYFRFKPLLEKIIKFPGSENTLLFNASTLHYFIQIFNEVVEFDPEYIIHTLAHLLKRGDSAYSLDPLASDEMLKFGEKIIGNHKDVLQDDEVLKDFIIIVDSFVKNGNKKMMQFVWRLDEIYR